MTSHRSRAFQTTPFAQSPYARGLSQQPRPGRRGADAVAPAFAPTPPPEGHPATPPRARRTIPALEGHRHTRRRSHRAALPAARRCIAAGTTHTGDATPPYAVRRPVRSQTGVSGPVAARRPPDPPPWRVPGAYAPPVGRPSRTRSTPSRAAQHRAILALVLSLVFARPASSAATRSGSRAAR